MDFLEQRRAQHALIETKEHLAVNLPIAEVSAICFETKHDLTAVGLHTLQKFMEHLGSVADVTAEVFQEFCAKWVVMSDMSDMSEIWDAEDGRSVLLGWQWKCFASHLK